MSHPGSRVTLFLCLLLPIFTAGCGGVNTITTRETPGVPATNQASLEPTRILSPSVSPTSEPTLAASPTPIFVFDLSGYDPDIFQPVVVEHQPPLIAQSDETVMLVFDLINTIFCEELKRNCRLEPRLYYSYGGAEAFQSLPLIYEIVNEMESLVARLPATDQAGKSLRYYAEFSVPEAGYTLRYPVAGTIDLFATSNLRFIELPPENAVEPGDKVYDFFWGYGPDKVRWTFYSPYGHRAGPPALDVARDGSIALIDPVNERVIIFNPGENRYSSAPLPFTYKFDTDLAFDQNDQLTVCDFQGEETEGAIENIPYCYRLIPDGAVGVSAPVYVKFPMKLTKGSRVLDSYDYRLVAPFNSQDVANSREAQRQKQTWELPYGFVMGVNGFDSKKARFADIMEGVAFEVHSDSSLGGILAFEKTPRGYLMTFSGGYEQIRAVWIDVAGTVLKDVTLPNGHYSELSFGGQVAVAQDGSLYVLNSTERGIEIHFEAAPQQ